MRVHAVFTLVSLILAVTILGVHADSISDYSENGELWMTTITNNNPSDVEYSIEMPNNADFDIYVWDEYNEKWYTGTAYQNYESVTVPQHKGYTHVLYIYAYDGAGLWTLTSDQVIWKVGSIKSLGIYSYSEIEQLLQSNLNAVASENNIPSYSKLNS